MDKEKKIAIIGLIVGIIVSLSSIFIGTVKLTTSQSLQIFLLAFGSFILGLSLGYDAGCNRSKEVNRES